MAEQDGVWRTIGGRRVFIKDGQSVEDAMRESGKFGKAPNADRQKQIDNLHIDFDGDNLLPELNPKDLKELDKKSKPVLLKKEIIERNLHEHPEVPQEEYDEIIKGALYDGDLRFKGKSERHNQDYMNFVKTIPHHNSLVLLQLAEHKDNYEIVHLFKVGDKNLERMQKK